ncbi:MAG: hypothetical protein ACRD11_11285 [Terriglobia bacterium]
MTAETEGFDRKVPLPPELKIVHIHRAIDYIERETGELIEVYLEQANAFSGLVGIFGVRALHSLSPYKKHKHPDVAEQRFPDLSLGGKVSPPPEQALESKGSTRPWALQSHYNHAGWYIVWRYLVDPAKIIKAGTPVVIWRVDVAFLKQEDWKYEGSKAAEGRGGRTYTFGVKLPAARFASAMVFQHPRIILRQSRPTLANGAE